MQLIKRGRACCREGNIMKIALRLWMAHTDHTFPVRDKTVPLVARDKNQSVNFDLQCIIMHSNMHTQRLTTFLVPSVKCDWNFNDCMCNNSWLKPCHIFKQPCRTWPQLSEPQPNSQMSFTRAHILLWPLLFINHFVPLLPFWSNSSCRRRSLWDVERRKKYGQRCWEFG